MWHRVDGASCGIFPFQIGQFLFHLGRRAAFSCSLQTFAEVAFESFAVSPEALQIGIIGGGRWREIEQIEGASGCGGEIRCDRGNDAPGSAGNQKDSVLVQLQTGFAGGRQALGGVCLRAIGCVEVDRPAQMFLVPDFNCAGIPQGLVDEELRDFFRSAARFEINSFCEGVGTLALVGLGEAGYRSAQWSAGPGFVVAMLSAQARG